jgi:hypothetical protein
MCNKNGAYGNSAENASSFVETSLTFVTSVTRKALWRGQDNARWQHARREVPLTGQ